ncbi:hypothetical protein FOL47_004838 [Perkinsus chesapeaki]|uniref:Uncharacterized protein n=1 Tax=Perkinsus chesapeaki TaxID=330153 RepID=A0A7J6M0G2_PERCH|nr:hypothetical protein FOL47_004838 [Perkinsus chesapeaki]
MSLSRAVKEIKQVAILTATNPPVASQREIAAKWSAALEAFVQRIGASSGAGTIEVSPMNLSRALQDVAKHAPEQGRSLVYAILPNIMDGDRGGNGPLPTLGAFGPVELAYLANSIANIIGSDSNARQSRELLRRFGQEVGEYFSKPGRLEAVPIYTLVTLTNALNRLGYDGASRRRREEDLYSRFDRLCCSKIESMNASDIAVALQSFHNGGCRQVRPSLELLSKASERLKGDLRQQIPSKSLAQLLNIFVTFGYTQDRDLLVFLFESILATPAEELEVFCAPLALNSLSKCYKALNDDSDIPLPTTLVFNLATKLDELASCQVANVVNALGSLQVMDYRLLKSMSHLIANSDGGRRIPLETFSFQELSNISHGFAKISYGSSDLYSTLFGEASRRRSEFDSQGVSMFLDSVRRVANRWFNSMMRDPNRPGPQPGLQYIPHSLMDSIRQLLASCESWSKERLQMPHSGGISVQSATQILLCLVELGRGSAASESPLAKCFSRTASTKGDNFGDDIDSMLPHLLIASLKERADKLTKEQTRHVAHASRRYKSCDSATYNALPEEMIRWLDDIHREFPASVKTQRSVPVAKAR